MFSFHKPKIYRSNLGCCICKAKSSSSRFTDSKKYENEFERCFRTQEKRSGEICNACVLLVKRWKKLSPDNRLTKHWHHVVDARAGPGTKVTGNRRLTSSSSTSSSSSASSSSLSAHNQSSSSYESKRCSTGKSETLPLSSSQANNQSGGAGTRGRTSSLSKARAIDTNVSTFTFGEPPSAYRRHAAGYSSSDYNSYAGCASPKPQSALSSSAFESVIKRFRQRQQQQQIESQRRQMNRLERQRRRQQQLNKSNNKTATEEQPPQQQQVESNDAKSPLPAGEESPQTTSCNSARRSSSAGSPSKRVKRSSENFGSHAASVEALKIASVLDGSIWRREKVCCGVIFRGPFNEVAVFPRLLKACDARLLKMAAKSAAPSLDCANNQEASGAAANHSATEEDLLKKGEEPVPRAHKSGSISSINSSTSGTGSMEPTLDEIKRNNRNQNDPSPAVRPRSVPNRRRRPAGQSKEDVESTSTSGASTLSSGKVDSPSGSDESSSRMMILVDGCEMMEDDDDDDEELVLADEEAEEEEEEEVSSNDASSSAGSLVEMDTKKSSAVA